MRQLHFSSISAALMMAIAMLLCGCTKNEFHIKFDLNANVEGNYRIVYHGTSKKDAIDVDAVVPVEKGKAMLKGITRYPTLVSIYRGGEALPSAIFYAERGDDIEITGDSPDPQTWTIKGNDISADWSRWRKDNARALSSGNPKEINRAVAAFVRDNRDSEVSTLIMLTSFDRRNDEKGFAELWNSISEDVRTEDIVELVGRADRPSAGAVPTPNKLSVVRLHALGDSLVEIKSSSSPATLLYFKRNDDNGGDIDADTVRRLAAIGKGRVAAISFETDSLAWRLRAHSDSLGKQAVNAWMPAAEASEESISLGVPRTPWFIVASRDGRQVYRGSDRGEAAAAFRKLAK